MPQNLVRALLGNLDAFKGGVYVTTNGRTTLHIMTAEERERELRVRDAEAEATAKIKAAVRVLNHHIL